MIERSETLKLLEKITKKQLENIDKNLWKRTPVDQGIKEITDNGIT